MRGRSWEDFRAIGTQGYWGRLEDEVLLLNFAAGLEYPGCCMLYDSTLIFIISVF